MGQAMGAVSVAALTQRMTAARVRRIAQQVRAAAAQIEQRIRTRKR